MTIYLDHNATTPLREEVARAMARALREVYGNPSSTHAVGAAARAELDFARERVAALVGARSEEVVFASGASEANHLAIHGVLARARAGAHVVTTAAEHASVDEPLRALEEGGLTVTRVGVDAEGLVDPAEVAAALRPETALLSVLLANNETGVIQDVAALSEPARARGVPFHVDATQAVGKIPVDAGALGADLLVGSAHKLYGPKGAGFLVQRRGVALEPWLRGGPQERRRRGGTENVVGIIGLGVACELAREELAERGAAMRILRDRLWDGLRRHVARVRRNGSPSRVLPNTLNVEIEEADAAVLLEALDLEGVCVSTGAACASGSLEPSHVLLAMGRTPAQARASLRLSVGHGVTAAQVDRVVALLAELVPRAREMAA